ncbi:MAG: cell division protein FtsW [Ruminococcaceae bacterium]|nr:cell division protein FtsW [Oscillospiraceae bacterium]
MIVMILLAIGLIMLFSASYATAYSQYGDSLYYIRNQVRYAALGFVALLAASVFDYHLFKKKPLMLVLSVAAAVFMVLVKLKPTEQGGAERWLTIGPITFQPSEILKFVVIILFAYFAEKNFEYLKDIKKGLLPFAIILMASCGLLMMQPHLSGTIIVFAIGFVMMYVAGVRPKYLILLLLGVGLLVAIAIPVLNALGYDYFTSRWVSFVAPESDIGDTTFQTYQSLVTIGSGGLFGLGFGNSRQKYSYLPMARNDFIFSIVCEELGFVGGMLVILLFVILVWRGFYICSKAKDKFGMLIAFGITFQIGLQALMNIAVVSNSMPNTGISLPFFSYGGTALCMQLGEMGVLLNISRKAELD